jgi:hypothetical protein
MNAFQTGIHAKREIIRGENVEDLETLTQLYYLRWSPNTPEQCYLVDVLVSTDWTTRRLRRVEAELWEHHISDAWQPDKKSPVGQAFQRATSVFESLARRIESTVRTNRKALEALSRLKAPSENAVPPLEPEPQALEPVLVPPPDSPQNQTDRPKIGFVLPLPVEARRTTAPASVGQVRNLRRIGNPPAGNMHTSGGRIDSPMDNPPNPPHKTPLSSRFPQFRPPASGIGF